MKPGISKEELDRMCKENPTCIHCNRPWSHHCYYDDACPTDDSYDRMSRSYRNSTTRFTEIGSHIISVDLI